MKRSKIRSSIILLTGIMGIFMFSAAALSMPESVDEAVDPAQEDSCLPILFEAAQRAGIPGVITLQYGNDGTIWEDDIYCSIEISEERDGGVYRTDLTIEAQPKNNYNCEGGSWDSSFHGYPAGTKRFSDEDGGFFEEMITHGLWSLNWIVESGGICHGFSVDNWSEYPGWSEDVSMGGFEGSGTDFQMPDADPLPYAEALWAVAEPYLPISDGISMDDGQSPPFNDGQNDSPGDFFNDGQNDSPGDFFNDSGVTNTGNNKVPVVVILGSIGVPVVGAIAGTILSTILSGGGAAVSGTAGVTPGKKPKFGSPSEDGMVWSPRPWDQAGPGYVPKDEFLRTKDFLEKGYKWTSQGWKTPDEIREYDQWQRNNDAAVVEEDAAWREQWEQERRELEEKKVELQEKGKQLDFSGNLLDLQSDFDAINKGLDKENIYVLNPYQGDPTRIFYGINSIKNIVWDNTAGHLTGDQGLTCMGFVDKTSDQVVKAVRNRFKGATVHNMIFEEKSTIKKNKSILDWVDSLSQENHNLIKVVLPDGSEWAVDFHQYKAGNSPLMRPWSEAVKAWGEDYLGAEFHETEFFQY